MSASDSPDQIREPLLSRHINHIGYGLVFALIHSVAYAAVIMTGAKREGLALLLIVLEIPILPIDLMRIVIGEFTGIGRGLEHWSAASNWVTWLLYTSEWFILGFAFSAIGSWIHSKRNGAISHRRDVTS